MWRVLVSRSIRIETASLIVLGAVLLVRFPVRFAMTQPYLMDLEVYRAVAERILQGQAADLYAPTTSELALFKYAPSWALPLVPLGWMSHHVGAVVWSGVHVALLLVTLVLCARLCRRLGIRYHPLAAVGTVLLLVRPLTAVLLNGQVNILWGLLVVGFLLGEAARRPWGAALSLALAISLKLPALLFLLYLALRRRWVSAGRTLLAFAVINLAAAWWLLPAHPLSLFASWYHVLSASGPARAFEIGSQSLLALMGRLLRPDGYGFNLLSLSDGAVAVVAVVVQVALLAAVFSPHAGRLPESLRLVLDGALLSVFMVLFSPTCWVATYSALPFPVFVALALFSSQPQAIWRHLPLTMGALAALLLSALTHAKVWRFFGVLAIKGETYVFEVLMILPLFGLALAWCLWHHRRRLAVCASPVPGVMGLPR